MFIKICGLTRFIDADYVNELLPDYVGFVFAPSKREVTLRQAREIAKKLDRRIKTVGVFVDLDGREDALHADFLDVLQFHGAVAQVSGAGVGVCGGGAGVKSVWKAVKAGDIARGGFALKNGGDYDMLVIDGVAPGGGVTWDAGLLQGFDKTIPFTLAGGLTVDNVCGTLTRFGKYNVVGVDVSSGVETDGVKDYTKMERFIRDVRRYVKDYDKIR